MLSLKIRRLIGILTVAGGLGLSALGVPAASAQTSPPTLAGEQFQASGSSMGPILCEGSGSFSYTVAGTATGPYPGTFTESGSGTANSGSLIDAGSLGSFTATFTISSATGQVTGTQTLISTNSGCYVGPDTFGADASTSYQATIHTSGGNYTDQGTTDTNAVGFDGMTSLSESFTSSQSQATLTAPTSRSECMNDGWQQFPQFKNQGQCVSYVATHGGS